MEKQLKSTKNDRSNAHKKAFQKIRVLNNISLEAKKTLDEIKRLNKKIDYTKLVCMLQMEQSLILTFFED